MKKTIKEQIIFWSGTVTIGVVLGISIQFVSAWVGPGSAPPAGNVEAPINTSNIGQAKKGGLALGAYGGAPSTALSVVAADLGIFAVTTKKDATAIKGFTKWGGTGSSGIGIHGLSYSNGTAIKAESLGGGTALQVVGKTSATGDVDFNGGTVAGAFNGCRVKKVTNANTNDKCSVNSGTSTNHSTYCGVVNCGSDEYAVSGGVRCGGQNLAADDSFPLCGSSACGNNADITSVTGWLGDCDVDGGTTNKTEDGGARETFAICCKK
ncbi:MAG: hypothetical protein COU40_01440 [Candidatus Moranbacteria bacterium CG10_big_fil_rev_8_21_14_0_10_35_21]|nr:MAG: hypothetical protein COU40_01440 [Candidatus Moranbacteria bacterium CG10_big_fil_rev_8_21_14_0_10_35_21]PJA88571.1 MAG: hypothetical protein CO139_02430 [Candidatus Moranbacteria bacterium CG_4_9_14_3_um_filter_36_9]